MEKEGRYFLFFGANDIQNDNETGGIGIAVSDKPEGPYKDYLGKPLVGKFQNGAQPIDQFVFKDKDGEYYLIYGGCRRPKGETRPNHRETCIEKSNLITRALSGRLKLREKVFCRLRQNEKIKDKR